MHTSSHSLRALLFFDTNYNVCFVQHLTQETDTCAQMNKNGNWSPKQAQTSMLVHAVEHGEQCCACETLQATIQRKQAYSLMCLPNPEWFNFPFGRLHIRHFLIPFYQADPLSFAFQHRWHASIFTLHSPRWIRDQLKKTLKKDWFVSRVLERGGGSHCWSGSLGWGWKFSFN